MFLNKANSKTNSENRFQIEDGFFYLTIFMDSIYMLMKKLLFTVLLILPTHLFSQQNTEVFLFDLNTKNGNFTLSNFKNISNNKGYDNQPSFVDDNTILYAGTRNDQTDIVKYNIKYDSILYMNHSEGSEYSPLKIPGQDAVSAIRLDKDGKQALRKYSLSNGESELIIEDIIIGYHVWFDEQILVSSVLEENYLSLYATHLNEMKNHKFQQNIGRSLHKIPNTNRVSFISKISEPWEITSLNPKNGDTKSIVTTIGEAEDMCWMNNGTILMGVDDTLYTYTPDKDADWIKVSNLKAYGITKITRVTISPDGNKLAIVGELIEKTELDPNEKLEPKIENVAWISGQWKGEAFGGQTEENWSAPSGGSMMAAFKLISDGKISFYEIEIIREVENSLILQLKHFDSELKGWESKDDTVDFPLKEITRNKVVFEGMTFEKIGNNEMNVYVDMHNDDGSVKTVKFNYKK
ncbi:hypothetical protein A9Q87_05200 [Flavobacteriales bacterium 34_180_T64]|nr:hypothetical protein A9Q87_05200 [Flavobacteriales bacterium 34_180_T64]